MKRSYKHIPEIAAEKAETQRFVTRRITDEEIRTARGLTANNEIIDPENDKADKKFKVDHCCILDYSRLERFYDISPFREFREKVVDGIKIGDYLERIKCYGDPTILNEAYGLEDPNLVAFPLLNPGSMQRLSREELERHFAAERAGLQDSAEDDNDDKIFIQKGPTLILTDRDKEVAAHDGSIERIVTVTRGRVSEVSDTTWFISSTPGSPDVAKVEADENSSASLVFNVAEYPVTEEVNPNGILLYLEGEHITPSAIAKIVRNGLRIKNPLGIHIVVDGELTCTAPHTLPTKPIDSSQLGDYANLVKQEGTFIGNGISSALKGHSNDAHIHTNIGHMREANGKVFVHILPARKEIRAEYGPTAR